MPREPGLTWQFSYHPYFDYLKIGGKEVVAAGTVDVPGRVRIPRCLKADLAGEY
jgi:hypothetical protein